MGMLKVDDIRRMSDDELNDAVVARKKERFNLRFQRATGQLENTARLREARKDIARIKTIAAERRQKTSARQTLVKPRPKGHINLQINIKTPRDGSVIEEHQGTGSISLVR